MYMRRRKKTKYKEKREKKMTREYITKIPK